jgi:UPF0755 protein
VTESKPPSNGSERTAADMRGEAARTPDKLQPVAAAPAPNSASVRSDPSSKPASMRPAIGVVGAPPPGSAARPRVPGGPATATKATSSPPATSSVSYSRQSRRAETGAGDSYAPASERLLNGAGTQAMDPTRATSRRITPRSPRTAIEPDAIELPVRRSKSARHPLVVIGNAVISIFVLLAIVVGTVLFLGKQRFEQPGPLAQDRIVNIPHGSGIRDIADVLTQQGVIDQPWVFIGGVLVLKAREDLKAGEYQFKAHASLRDVVATMVEGKVVAHQVSIPEGLTSQQITARLMDDDVLTGSIKEIPREGSLLPDTYNFTRGVTREQLIQRMQQAQQHLVHEIWDHRSADLPIKTPDQLVVLASLIEKETGKPEERTRVAAVFVNRLKQRMRLQSDPTIIYGLVGGKGTLGRPIMKSEIEQPTPYNTYQIDGLPPGPIANPGRASLEAAANPARTRELYFVADGAGGHAFAETYEQHQKNVARLRAMETEQNDQAPIDAQAPAPSTQSAPAQPVSSAAPPPRAPSKPRAQAVH